MMKQSEMEHTYSATASVVAVHLGVLSGTSGIFDGALVDAAIDQDAGDDVAWTQIPGHLIWVSAELGVAVGKFGSQPPAFVGYDRVCAPSGDWNLIVARIDTIEDYLSRNLLEPSALDPGLEVVNWERIPHNRIWFSEQLGLAVGKYGRMRHRFVVVPETPSASHIDSWWEYQLFIAETTRVDVLQRLGEATKEWLFDPFGRAESASALADFCGYQTKIIREKWAKRTENRIDVGVGAVFYEVTEPGGPELLVRADDWEWIEEIGKQRRQRFLAGGQVVYETKYWDTYWKVAWREDAQP
jgi:hypothetical protein